MQRVLSVPKVPGPDIEFAVSLANATCSAPTWQQALTLILIELRNPDYLHSLKARRRATGFCNQAWQNHLVHVARLWRNGIGWPA